jgi:hypothetical protein
MFSFVPLRKRSSQYRLKPLAADHVEQRKFDVIVLEAGAGLRGA